ncbi:LysE/ArgO family amino acid transporter [Actinocorallia populi]|uniref:LysE/ArgO family amino acid transporter n=1 Tax=Actinocorallia populi TaxID=2079200 RepID=UPI000D095B58|nr:LysE/ArgO family amino acid transporter [Actinocorallia populi]
MFVHSLAGLGFGLSLIVAIGAQNMFVLRQGVRREHVGVVVAICALSDAILISVGVAGAGALLTAMPRLDTVMRWGGAAFLTGYAALAALRALRPTGTSLRHEDAGSPGAGRAGTAAVAGTALALTWLNPHVYLDTVTLLGSVAGGRGGGRWWFGAGAILASLLWFTALGYGARALRPLLARPNAWRVLDGVIAAVMLAIAVSLVAGA